MIRKEIESFPADISNKLRTYVSGPFHFLKIV